MNPSWVTAIASTIFGISAIFFAYQQWKINTSKLKLDLFEKRYAVYDGVRKFLSVILSEATFTDKDLFQYYADTSDAEFLFGSEVVTFIDKVKRKSLRMRTLQKKYDRLPTGEKRSELVEKEHVELEWLMGQLSQLRKVFSPYLSFSKEANDPFDVI